MRREANRLLHKKIGRSTPRILASKKGRSLRQITATSLIDMTHHVLSVVRWPSDDCCKHFVLHHFFVAGTPCKQSFPLQHLTRQVFTTKTPSFFWCFRGSHVCITHVCLGKSQSSLISHQLVRPAAPQPRLASYLSESFGQLSCSRCTIPAVDHDDITLVENRTRRNQRFFFTSASKNFMLHFLPSQTYPKLARLLPRVSDYRLLPLASPLFSPLSSKHPSFVSITHSWQLPNRQ